MPTHNAKNERIKRKYFAYLKEAMRHSEPTVDAVAKALNRFEVYGKHRDFKTFHFEQAVGFKKHLAEQKAKLSGEKLSKATLNATLNQIKQFFQWLSRETGYKSSIKYSDAEYFNLSEKDTRIATAKREQRSPTMAQIKHVITSMPTSTELEQRNRALVAFTLLTGARDSAIASAKLKHIDLLPEHIDDITRLFGQFEESTRPVDNNLVPISRIFKNEDFGYRTITVERPERDAAGNIVLATKGKGKGKPMSDSALRDTENVPLSEDVETYFKREVLPHAPDAWIDHDKTKVGYEIPFNRHFYVFKPPRPLDEIDAELKGVTDRILTMIGGLTA